MSSSRQRQKDDSVRIGQTGSCHSLVESLIICSSRGENKTWWSGREVRDSPYPSLLTGRLIITTTHSTLFRSKHRRTDTVTPREIEFASVFYLSHVLFLFKHTSKRLRLLWQSRMLLWPFPRRKIWNLQDVNRLWICGGSVSCRQQGVSWQGERWKVKEQIRGAGGTVDGKEQMYWTWRIKRMKACQMFKDVEVASY